MRNARRKAHILINTPRFKPVIKDREIWACANTLLQQHGADAWFVASQRADELLAKGELDGHRTFMRIVGRIEKMESMRPEGSVQ